jgi:hypothetical protein
MLLAHNILNRKIQETLVLIFFFAGSESDVDFCRWVRAGYTLGGRRVGRTRAQIDGFFFQNRTLFVSYMYPSRVHGYHGYGYGSTRARVWIQDFFFLLFLFVIFFFCCFYFANIFFILQCRKIWIISFRLSTNLNVHFKRIIYFLNVHFLNYFKIID